MPSECVTGLAYLMKKFGITNQKLAAILHVDPSLISKWRNKKRLLRHNSAHLSKITDYFLSLDSPHHSIIKEILAQHYPRIRLDSPECLKSTLTKWIAHNSINFQPEEMMQDYPGVSYTGKFDVYLNNAGRRAALQRFHDLLLTLPPGQKILYFTQEDFTWLVEYASYRASWQDKLKAIIDNGHHITIIHTMVLDFKYLFPIDSGWIPIHMSGRTSALYLPKHINTVLSETMFIIKNKAALIGLTGEKQQTTFHTIFFSDPLIVQQYEARFEALLANSRPLLEKYTAQQTSELAQLIISAEQQPGNCYLYSSFSLEQITSTQVFHSILLEKQVRSEDYEMYLASQARLQHLFHKNLGQAYYRHIVDYNAITKMPASKLSPRARSLAIEYITNLLSMLEKYLNYEVALISNNLITSLFNSHLWVKDNAIAVISTPTINSQSSFAITITEPTAVHSFYQYLDDFWLSIPRIHRERLWVQNKLRLILQQLEFPSQQLCR
ncbi:MAG: hypothetical protein GX893_06670 [Firmicutes bacterium]|nr:hypothetical protein [Bacillota bacterium]